MHSKNIEMPDNFIVYNLGMYLFLGTLFVKTMLKNMLCMRTPSVKPMTVLCLQSQWWKQTRQHCSSCFQKMIKGLFHQGRQQVQPRKKKQPAQSLGDFKSQQVGKDKLRLRYFDGLTSAEQLFTKLSHTFISDFMHQIFC